MRDYSDETDDDKGALNGGERLECGEALRAVTYDAAWQCHAEKRVGSLERGKLADFVILAKDPMAMSREQAYLKMRYIPVELVFVGGILVGDFEGAADNGQ